jgi:hypothetical protein
MKLSKDMGYTILDCAMNSKPYMSSLYDKYTTIRANNRCVENDLVQYRHDEPQLNTELGGAPHLMLMPIQDAEVGHISKLANRMTSSRSFQ